MFSRPHFLFSRITFPKNVHSLITIWSLPVAIKYSFKCFLYNANLAIDVKHVHIYFIVLNYWLGIGDRSQSSYHRATQHVHSWRIMGVLSMEVSDFNTESLVLDLSGQRVSRLSGSLHVKWVSEWLLFNANSANFQLHHGENKLIIN